MGGFLGADLLEDLAQVQAPFALLSLFGRMRCLLGPMPWRVASVKGSALGSTYRGFQGLPRLIGGRLEGFLQLGLQVRLTAVHQGQVLQDLHKPSLFSITLHIDLQGI